MADEIVRLARARREREAARYRPANVKLLLVAEAPPASLDRYFFFDDVTEQDSLFRYVYRGLLGKEPSRSDKSRWLAEICDLGVFLIDLKEEPVDGTPLKVHVPSLVERCRALDPDRIILIKTTVYDAAYHALREAGMPVCDARIPFPVSGRQREFEAAFARALKTERRG
jgi:hypothetical protein